MPKKTIRNSFYFYMQDFKEQQRKLGIAYANLKEVADAAGPAWRDESPNVRAKYDAMAKAEKSKYNIPEHKFTSTGQSLADIERIEQERRQAKEAELQDIQDFVTRNTFSGDILNEDIFLMDINCYCKAGDSHLVGEMALLRFSLRDGIRDTYHELINPGNPPVGYAYEVKLGCEELSLPPPGETPPSSAAALLAHLVDYLRRGQAGLPTDRARAGVRAHSAPPPVYTLPDKVPAIVDFIQQLCNKAAEDETMFRVYRLDWLMFQLLRAVAPSGEGAFPRESLALTQLTKDVFQYTPNLGCDHHESGERPHQCCLSRVKRWAYTVLDKACGVADITPLAGRHVPHDYDIDSILSFREAHAPLHTLPRSLDDSLSLSDSFRSDKNQSASASYASAAITSSANTSASGATEGSRKEKRVHVPLRKPIVDPLQGTQSRCAPPRLSDRDDFPDFPSPVTKGRGRGVAAISNSFGNLNM